NVIINDAAINNISHKLDDQNMLVANENAVVGCCNKLVSSQQSTLDVLTHWNSVYLMLVSTILPFDALAWWKENALRYPSVSSMAGDILAVPITSVASEAYSGKNLTPETVETLICG
ncbi:7943_t:CDS:2, partial [Diversispora eburnea]